MFSECLLQTPQNGGDNRKAGVLSASGNRSAKRCAADYHGFGLALILAEWAERWGLHYSIFCPEITDLVPNFFEKRSARRFLVTFIDELRPGIRG